MKKPKRRPTSVKKPNLTNPTALPNAAWHDEKQIRDTVEFGMTPTQFPHTEKSREESSTPEVELKTLVSIATNAWRAKVKMIDTITGEVREDMKRVHRHIEAIFRNLAELGIFVRDHTNDAYDEGQPMKVVASKPSPGLDKERVSETLLPSIFWNNQPVQNGEIVIATPSAPNTPAESQPHQP